MIIVLIIVAVLFVYFLIGLCITALLDYSLFGVRGKDPDHPCYLVMEDFPFLSKEKYECIYKNRSIRGYIYKSKKQKNFKGFIILAHGLFGTHLQYMADIAFLCENGYKVLAFDQYGVGESDGKNQVSFVHGTYVLEAVLKDVEERNLNKTLAISLYGHSWGAYCCLSILKNHPEIDKTVLRSGPVSVLYSSMHLLHVFKPFVYYLLVPILPLCILCVLSFNGLSNCTKHYKKYQRNKILVIQAMDDPMVKYSRSQAYFFKKHNREDTQILITDSGLHNSIITEDSYHEFTALAKEYKEIMSIDDIIKKAQSKKRFLSELDRASHLKYNQEVIDGIIKFLD